MSEAAERPDDSTISADELATLTGWSTQWILDLAKKDYYPKAKHGQYKTVETLRALFRSCREQQAKKSGNLAQEQLRAQTAKADLLELELHKRRGKLVETAAAGQCWKTTL